MKRELRLSRSSATAAGVRQRSGPRGYGTFLDNTASFNRPRCLQYSQASGNVHAYGDGMHQECSRKGRRSIMICRSGCV